MERFPLEKTILEPFLSHEVEHENIIYDKLPEIARRAAENFGNRLYFQDFLQYNFIFQTGVGGSGEKLYCIILQTGVGGWVENPGFSNYVISGRSLTQFSGNSFNSQNNQQKDAFGNVKKENAFGGGCGSLANIFRQIYIQTWVSLNRP